jgi:acyl-CoA synthetase (AMP-forming)/AMP-acid ligase II
MLVPDLLITSSTRTPEAEALIAGSRRVSYGELHAAAVNVASSLVEAGLLPGERVAVLTDSPFDFIVSYFGTLLAGGVFVGMNTQTTGRTVGHLLGDCGAAFLVVDRRFLPHIDGLSSLLPSVRRLVVAGGGAVAGFSCCDLADLLNHGGGVGELLPQRSETDLAQIIYTSGTTGNPKGVMLTHRNLVANTLSTVQYLALSGRDRVMMVLPFFYSYGNSILLTHVAVGGAMIVNQSLLYPNVILEQMASEKVTGFSGVPSTFALLLHRSSIQNYTFPSLRYITQAGGAMSPALARKLAAALPNADIYVMYGQTEAAPRLTYLPPADLYRKPGSIGKGIPGVALEVMTPAGEIAVPGEVGELVATGDNVMVGYWGQPEATAEVLHDGKLWTGDLVRSDDEGYLYVVGRKSEMIKSGAHRIAPKEIEEVLHEHAAVYDAAVLGVEDELLGEAIKACVVLKQGVVCLEKELLRHCRQSLPAFKLPHIIEFREELPKTDTGKTRKSELKGAPPAG